MEGNDPKNKLDKSYWSGLKANWTLWPAVQAINFKVVPLDYRVLLVNLVSIGEFPSDLLSFDKADIRRLELLLEFLEQCQMSVTIVRSQCKVLHSVVWKLVSVYFKADRSRY